MSYVESLRVFIRVVELEASPQGGRDLRLTPAVASKRIKELENRLGVRLFNRTTRSITPTEAGRVFYDDAREVLTALDSAEARVSSFSDSPRGAIRVTAPLGVGRRIVAPFRAGIFRPVSRDRSAHAPFRPQGRHPGRWPGSGILRGRSPGQQHEAAKDYRLRPGACAAPGYLDKAGVPAHPEDLLNQNHNCLLLRYPRSPEYFWTLTSAGGPLKLDVRGKFDATMETCLLTGLWPAAGSSTNRDLTWRPISRAAI